MNNTPASNETKLGLLDHESLNKYEAYGLEQMWKFLLKHRDEKLESLLVNQAHRFGFDFLYDWAGQYRKTRPLVGQLLVPEYYKVAELMKMLFDDLDYKIDSIDCENIESIIELVTWFEYKFIWIHPYANTNGRTGRMLSNFILVKLGYPPLKYANRSKVREKYIEAMRYGDAGDLTELENFIASELEEAIEFLQEEE